LDHLEATCADLHSHLADHLAGATAALPMHTLDSLFIDPWRHEELRGIVLATLLLTFLAELFSFRSVRSIMHHNGPTLYLQAVALCVFNTAVLGPLTLAAVTQLRLLRPPRTSPHAYSLEWEWRFKWMAVDANEVVFLVVLHSIGYWCAHRLMHTTRWGWWAHKFHHRFAHAVSPVIANAVSPAEYVAAYMTPFVLAAVLAHPSRATLMTAAAIVSICNISIHMEALGGLTYPWFFVSPGKHQEHHRKPSRHYAAPTFDVGAIAKRALGLGETWRGAKRA